MRVRWLRSLEALRALGPAYDELVLASGPEGLFYQLGWIERAWPHYHRALGGALAFALVEDGNGPVALAPLALRNKSWAHARQSVLGFVGGTFDELDNWVPRFLVRPGVEREALRAIAAAITVEPWDRLELRALARGGAALEVMRGAFFEATLADDPLTTPRARVDGGWAAYRAALPKRLTRMLDRGPKRAAEEGVTLAFETARAVPPAMRGELETLHLARQDRLRQSGKKRSSPFEDPFARSVFWSLVDFAAARDQLRAHLLRIDGRLAAFVLALHHAGTSFGYFNAIDPAAERFSPGNLILAATIEREVAERGATTIDLMIGANLTKSLFATEELAHVGIAVVNPSRPVARLKAAWIDALKRA